LNIGKGIETLMYLHKKMELYTFLGYNTIIDWHFDPPYVYNILHNKLTTLQKMPLGLGGRHAFHHQMRIVGLKVALWETVLDDHSFPPEAQVS